MTIEKFINKFRNWNRGYGVYTNGNLLYCPYGVVAFNEDCVELMKYPHLMEDSTVQKVERIFNATYENELEIPDRKQIRKDIKELCQGNHHRVKYSFGEYLPVVNARYLADILDTMEVYKIKFNKVDAPILFLGKKANVILLPIHCSEYGLGIGCSLG